MNEDAREQAELPDDDIQLPDPREVNRRIRQEAQLAKARASISTRNVGEWAHLLEGACAKKRLYDVKAQLNYLYSHGVLKAGIGGDREVGHETQSKHCETMENLFDDLKKIGMRLKDVRHLGRVHVVAAIKHWQKLGQASSTIQTKTSVVRRFLVLIGKPQVMPKGTAWTEIQEKAGVRTRELKRKYVATESKSWVARGVDARTKIEAVWADSPACGAALMLQMISGCRVSESLTDSPMTMDCDQFLCLKKGTKGGRRRNVKLAVTEEQFEFARQMLERVKLVAAKAPRKVLRSRNESGKWRTLKQMRRHFYYIMDKHGITMAKEGITPHGLRHGFLQGRFEDLSGLPPPVLRLAPALAYEQNDAAVAAAKKGVSEDAGHSRDAAYYYIGNKIAMSKAGRRAEEDMLASLGGNAEIAAAFERVGVITGWLVGRIAYGVVLEPEMALEVHVLLSASAPHDAEIDLQRAMQEALGRWVTVTVSRDPLRRPEVGSEIVFDRERVSKPDAETAPNEHFPPR